MLRRELPSESHKHAWANFEKILMYRTNVAFIVRILLDWIFFFIGESDLQTSEKYILKEANREVIPYNKDFTDATFGYFKNAYMILFFSRVIFVGVSFKYLKVTKAIAYLQLAKELIFELGIPINRGSESAAFVNMKTTLYFSLDYFHFWPTAIFCSAVSITNGVAKGYLYSNQMSNIVSYEVILNVLTNFLTQTIIHIIINAAGMLFVEAELLRVGNETLLNDLDEGVIIIDEGTGKVSFLNSAAEMFNIKLDENFSMQSFDDEEKIDLDKKLFAFMDKEYLKGSNDINFILQHICKLEGYLSLRELTEEQAINNLAGKHLLYKVARKKPREEQS